MKLTRDLVRNIDMPLSYLKAEHTCNVILCISKFHLTKCRCFVSLDIYDEKFVLQLTCRLRLYSLVVKQPYRQSGDTGSILVGELRNFLIIKLEIKLFI